MTSLQGQRPDWARQSVLVDPPMAAVVVVVAKGSQEAPVTRGSPPFLHTPHLTSLARGVGSLPLQWDPLWAPLSPSSLVQAQDQFLLPVDPLLTPQLQVQFLFDPNVF